MQIKDLIPWARKDAAPQTKTEDDHPIATLQRDMNRVFDTFWNRFEQSFGGLDLPFGGAAARSDVVETAEGVEVSIELPGMEQGNVVEPDDVLAFNAAGETRLSASHR